MEIIPKSEHRYSSHIAIHIWYNDISNDIWYIHISPCFSKPTVVSTYPYTHTYVVIAYVYSKHSNGFLRCVVLSPVSCHPVTCPSVTCHVLWYVCGQIERISCCTLDCLGWSWAQKLPVPPRKLSRNTFLAQKNMCKAPIRTVPKTGKFTSPVSAGAQPRVDTHSRYTEQPLSQIDEQPPPGSNKSQSGAAVL